MNTIARLVQRTSSATSLALAPLNATSLRDQAYALLKNAIADTDIYDPNQELRLDERQLTTALGVSRTPIREALSLLEQEGFIRTIPRRGIYIIRKSKREMIEMIQMWAALESMAARLATLHASDAEIATLRHLFDEFQNSPPSEHLNEYSDANIAFHTAVIALGGSQTIVDATRNLLIHVRAIRRATIIQNDRAARSIIDHLKIIEALERRDTELAERLTRQHTLDLAAHVDRYCDFLDEAPHWPRVGAVSAPSWPRRYCGPPASGTSPHNALGAIALTPLKVSGSLIADRIRAPSLHTGIPDSMRR
jgi:DNA-binding GntR family transcriptional regulator